MDTEPLTEAIIGAGIEVHRVLGPGLLESIYEEALCVELGLCGYRIARQTEIDVNYKGHIIKGLKVDVLVEGQVIVHPLCTSTFFSLLPFLCVLCDLCG